jgi:hypothetical protein
MPSTIAAPSPPSLKEQLIREACAMVRHLTTDGTRVPAQLVNAVEQFETAMAQGRRVDMVALASAHERLSRLVAPAKPGTLYLLDDSYHIAAQSSLGPVKLVRDLVKVAMVCVGLFIVLSVIAMADAHRAIDVFGVEGPEAATTAKDNHGWMIVKIILERIFWLSAAGIGASFVMLFQLNDQIVNRTFDPDENASYWVKFFLGLVAGFILVALVPFGSTSGGEGATTGAQALGPPTIALLGGFSASAVYRILTRMVEALESIFSGGAREQMLAAEKAAVFRAAEETGQARMAVASQLVQIQQRVALGMPPHEVSAQLRDVVATLVPSAETPPAFVTVPAEKVPALVVVSTPEDAVASADTDDSEDEGGADAAEDEASGITSPAAAG